MGIMKGLLYRDLGRLRHDWVMLTFVVIGGAMPWISLIRDGIERADAAAATVGLAAALASMLMIVVPPVISGLVGGDRSDGVLETFRFSGRPMGEYVAEKLLLGTVPVAGYTVVILLVAARVIGVTDAGLIAFTLTATVLFCVFTTLGRRQCRDRHARVGRGTGRVGRFEIRADMDSTGRQDDGVRRSCRGTCRRRGRGVRQSVRRYAAGTMSRVLCSPFRGSK